MEKEYFYSGYGYDKTDKVIYKFDGTFVCTIFELETLRKLIFQDIGKQTDMVATINFISINKI